MGTHGSKELDEDAQKLEAMGLDPGPCLEDLEANRLIERQQRLIRCPICDGIGQHHWNCTLNKPG